MTHRTPGFRRVPQIFIVAMSFLVVRAIYYSPLDRFIGVAMTAAGTAVYLRIAKGQVKRIGGQMKSWFCWVVWMSCLVAPAWGSVQNPAGDPRVVSALGLVEIWIET